jgi:glycosyltransferase involved in cell wall biosynthesis
VSIILPARNEERSIERALDALNALAYPRERYEVIVVDNGSTDATTRIARSRGVQVLQHPEGRVGAVRNAGAAGATGSILAFLDADRCRGRALCCAGDRHLG